MVSPDWEETVGKTSRQPKKWIEDMKEDVDTEKYIFKEAKPIVHARVKWERERKNKLHMFSIHFLGFS